MGKIIELRQDRALIRTNFDGYKLSLDPVPVLRQDLLTAPHKAEPDENQYSLLHAELFSMQNLLHGDPWARTQCFFINRLGEIARCSYNESNGRSDAIQIVFRLASIPEGNDAAGRRRRPKGDYNYSLRFISEKFCVLCDGMEHLLLFDTGDRLKATEWKLITTARIADNAERNDTLNFVLYDCRLDIAQEQKKISLALGTVKRVDVADGASSHYLHIHLAKWILKDTWEFSVLDTLEGKGSLYYCAFEPRAESIILSSNREVIFRSQKEAIIPTVENGTNAKPQLHEESTLLCGYSWTQTDEDIVVKFTNLEHKEKTDYNIKHTAEKLTVKCGDEVLLDSALFAGADKDLTTWTMINNSLVVTIVKENLGFYWTSLLVDGTGPKETLENGSGDCMPDEQKPVANLEAPIEDCDFPMGTLEQDVKIERFHLPTKTITHTVVLGTNPPIFSTNLRPGFPLALATREDVDTCLWLQQYNPSRPDEWSLRHEGNLHAFGYVQASKQQKKFVDCSPDLSYAVICESYRHVFLYQCNYDGANGLRNRNGPQISIGKQHLIALEEAGEVLGIVTAPNVITLLTERCVLHLQIN